MSDAINPDHYKRLPAEAIEIIESAIDGAPSNQDAYLHGQVLKYILRCWSKNGIEDLRKAKWYLDRLIESFETHVRQKEAELQSLKDHPFGKLKEPVIKQSLNAEPPDGWRLLEVGEVIRKGDKYRDLKSQTWIEVVVAVGDSLQDFHEPTIRRNRFEVGEKVVHGDCKSLSISVVENILGDGWVDLVRDGVSTAYHVKDLAPYIEVTREVTREVTGEVKNPLGCPDGWRWLERGELIRNGDKPVKGDAIPLLWIGTPCCGEEFILRRNRFEVGEKVIAKDRSEIWEVTSIINGVYQLKNDLGFFASFPEHLAPYIEETT